MAASRLTTLGAEVLADGGTATKARVSTLGAQVLADGGTATKARVSTLGVQILRTVATGSATGTWASTEAADTAALDGRTDDSGAWISTEAADISNIRVHLTNTGPFVTSERADTWATSSGYTRFGIDTFEARHSGASTVDFNISTGGPDRIIIVSQAGVSVSDTETNTERVSGITDSAGLTWRQELFMFAGPDSDITNSVISIWWAYAHDKLTSDAVHVSYEGSANNDQLQWFTVKGLNGNYEYPFDTNTNHFSEGSAVGAFSGADTAPAAYSPIATGPAGTSVTTTSFDATTNVNATLSGGNLTVTSSGASSPNNHAQPTVADQENSGKYYFECELQHIAGSKYGFGVATTNATLSTFANTGTYGAICRGDGTIWTGSQVATLGVTPVDTDIIGCAVDIDSGKVWFKDITQSGYWNGSAAANPAADVGGIAFDGGQHASTGQQSNISPPHAAEPPPPSPGYVLPISLPDGTSSSAQQIFNFGGTSYSGTAPTSFANWPHAATSVGHVDYPSLVFTVTMAPTGGGYADMAPAAGFEQLMLGQQLGGQRNVAMQTAFKLFRQNILLSDDERLVSPATAPRWRMAYATLVGGAFDPGSWESTEAGDSFHAVGYPGLFGVIGFFTPTGTQDTFAALGFQPVSGTLSVTGAPDQFSAYIKQPLTGTLAATGAPDVMHATGIGLGEDGVFIVTEAVDIMTAVGNTPISGSFDTTELADRVRAIGAGVGRVRRRRTFFVT